MAFDALSSKTAVARAYEHQVNQLEKELNTLSSDHWAKVETIDKQKAESAELRRTLVGTQINSNDGLTT